MRALILGGSGQLGTALLGSAPPDWTIIAPPRLALDLEDPASIDATVGTTNPDVIFNAAGFTNVEEAERDPALAMRINGDGSRHVADAATRYGARLIAISTDYVFDGTASIPYKPDAPTNPLNAYGRSKLQGEREVLTRAPGSLIIRTAWLYGPTGRNFVRTMLNRMSAGAPLRVINDQTGTPTSTASLAQAIWVAAARPDVSGIHHFTDSGAATWFDFAVAIAAEAHDAGLLSARPGIAPITSAEFQTAARRPAYSVLDSSATNRVLALDPPIWCDALRRSLREMANQVGA